MKKQQNGAVMQTLEQRRVLITGGSRGLGLGVVEALVAHHANVTVIARDSARLTELKARLGVSIILGDATDPKLAESALREARPSVLVLNAGATPMMAPLHEQTWESFSKNWNTDVRATFHWIQSAPPSSTRARQSRADLVQRRCDRRLTAVWWLRGRKANDLDDGWLRDRSGKRSQSRHSISGAACTADRRRDRARPRRCRSLRAPERR